MLTSCVSCGRYCSLPTGALYEQDHVDGVFAALNDPHKYVIVQTAPVRAALGEAFGLPIGTNVQGKWFSSQTWR